VQANNWREMPEFAELGRKFGVDVVLFTGLKNWGTYSREDYAERAVHLPEHPDYDAFKRWLQQPAFSEKGVLLGDLAA
jgi:hypothetical protein